MSQVITLQGFAPIPRYDGTAFATAEIYESASTSVTSSYSLIDTITLSPADSDPTDPATRNLTTDSASDTEGLWYYVVFKDGSGNASAPTDPVSNPSSTLYCTRAELKSWLGITGTSQDAEIDDALEAASRVIDKRKDTRFYPVTETRTYSPSVRDCSVRVDDLNTAGTVTVDVSGSYDYSTTWMAGTHYALEPANAALTGEPYHTLRLLPQSGAQFSGVINGLRIVGSFGWPSAPFQVKQACKILASRYYERRKTPLGVSAVAEAALYLRKTDPDVADLLENTGGAQPLLIA